MNSDIKIDVSEFILCSIAYAYLSIYNKSSEEEKDLIEGRAFSLRACILSKSYFSEKIGELTDHLTEVEDVRSYCQSALEQTVDELKREFELKIRELLKLNGSDYWIDLLRDVLDDIKVKRLAGLVKLIKPIEGNSSVPVGAVGSVLERYPDNTYEVTFEVADESWVDVVIGEDHLELYGRRPVVP